MLLPGSLPLILLEKALQSLIKPDKALESLILSLTKQGGLIDPNYNLGGLRGPHEALYGPIMLYTLVAGRLIAVYNA